MKNNGFIANIPGVKLYIGSMYEPNIPFEFHQLHGETENKVPVADGMYEPLDCLDDAEITVKTEFNRGVTQEVEIKFNSLMNMELDFETEEIFIQTRSNHWYWLMNRHDARPAVEKEISFSTPAGKQIVKYTVKQKSAIALLDAELLHFDNEQ